MNPNSITVAEIENALDGMDGILDDDEVLIDDTDLGEDNLLNDQDILDE